MSDHHGKVHTYLAGRFSLLGCPKERLAPVAAAQGAGVAIFDMPGGGTFRIRLFTYCIHEFHTGSSGTDAELYACKPIKKRRLSTEKSPLMTSYFTLWRPPLQKNDRNDLQNDHHGRAVR
jgi:hypothetical protein